MLELDKTPKKYWKHHGQNKHFDELQNFKTLSKIFVFDCVSISTKLFDLHNFKSYIYAQKFIEHFNI